MRENAQADSPSTLFGGITKEMWTVLLDKPEGWQGSDVFCETEGQAESQLATLRELDAKYCPDSTELSGAVVTRCIVSIYPPNTKAHSQEGRERGHDNHKD